MSLESTVYNPLYNLKIKINLYFCKSWKIMVFYWLDFRCKNDEEYCEHSAGEGT